MDKGKTKLKLVEHKKIEPKDCIDVNRKIKAANTRNPQTCYWADDIDWFKAAILETGMSGSDLMKIATKEYMQRQRAAKNENKKI